MSAFLSAICYSAWDNLGERWDLWQPGLGVVDVTNPEARKWYEAKLDALVDLGVDTFKVGLE